MHPDTKIQARAFTDHATETLLDELAVRAVEKHVVKVVHLDLGKVRDGGGAVRVAVHAIRLLAGVLGRFATVGVVRQVKRAEVSQDRLRAVDLGVLGRKVGLVLQCEEIAGK